MNFISLSLKKCTNTNKNTKKSVTQNVTNPQHNNHEDTKHFTSCSSAQTPRVLSVVSHPSPSCCFSRSSKTFRISSAGLDSSAETFSIPQASSLASSFPSLVSSFPSSAYLWHSLL